MKELIWNHAMYLVKDVECIAICHAKNVNDIPRQTSSSRTNIDILHQCVFLKRTL